MRVRWCSLLISIPAAEFLSNVDEHLTLTKTNHEQALAKQQVIQCLMAELLERWMNEKMYNAPVSTHRQTDKVVLLGRTLLPQFFLRMG